MSCRRGAIGQGTNTVFSQIAAEALGIDCTDVDVVQPDTSVVPNSGPNVTRLPLTPERLMALMETPVA